MKEGKTFLEYINASSKDPAMTDAYQIVMLAQMLSRNICIMYGNSEKWSTDPTMQDDIVLVYKGNGEFLPSDVGTYQYYFLFILNQGSKPNCVCIFFSNRITQKKLHLFSVGQVKCKTSKLWPASFQQISQQQHSDDNKSEKSEVSTTSTEISDPEKKKKTRASRKSSEKITEYVCSHCAHTSKDWSNFEGHNKIFHNVSVIFTCGVQNCFKFYISKNGLKGHCVHKHKEELGCNKCDYIATSPPFLLDHQKSDELKKFKCPFCTKGFGSSYDQNCHQVKCQQNPNHVITCKKCLVKGTPVDVAGAEQGFVLHLHSEHNLKGIWLCVYCHKLYINENQFDSHYDKCKKPHGKAKQSSTEDDKETDT